MFTIELENYQSHKKSSFSFPVGITALTGANNSGKSAVLRALKDATLNSMSIKSNIKKGEDFFKVSFGFGSNTCTFFRYHDKTSYIINNIEYNAIKRHNLFKIAPDFPLALDDQEELTNVQGEFDVMFPFGRKSTEMFKLFEDLFAISNSSYIISYLSKTKKDLNLEIKTVEASKELSNKYANTYSEYESKLDENITKGLYTKILKTSQETNSIAKSINTLKTIESKIVKNPMSSKEFKLNELQTFNFKLEKDLITVRESKDITNIPDIKDFSNIPKLFSECITLKSKIQTIKKVKSNTLIKPEYINTFDLSYYKSLINSLNILKNSNQLIKDSELKLNSLTNQLVSLKTELNKIPVCTACNRPL